MPKMCDTCNENYKGFGSTCARCRKGPQSSKCVQCGQLFVGFGTVCVDCKEQEQKDLAQANEQAQLEKEVALEPVIDKACIDCKEQEQGELAQAKEQAQLEKEIALEPVIDKAATKRETVMFQRSIELNEYNPLSSPDHAIAESHVVRERREPEMPAGNGQGSEGNRRAVRSNETTAVSRTYEMTASGYPMITTNVVLNSKDELSDRKGIRAKRDKQFRQAVLDTGLVWSPMDLTWGDWGKQMVIDASGRDVDEESIDEDEVVFPVTVTTTRVHMYKDEDMYICEHWIADMDELRSMDSESLKRFLQPAGLNSDEWNPLSDGPMGCFSGCCPLQDGKPMIEGMMNPEGFRFPLLMRMFFIRVEEMELDEDKMMARMTEYESEVMEQYETESTSTTASDGSEAWKLPFLAVYSLKGATVLASYDTDLGGPMMDVFKIRLAITPLYHNLTEGQHTRLPWDGDSSVCGLKDKAGENMYCVFTSRGYPEGLAYQMLHDLADRVQLAPGLEQAVEKGLQDQLETQMRADRVELALGLEQAAQNGMQDQLETQMRELVVYYEDRNNFPQFQVRKSEIEE